MSYEPWAPHDECPVPEDKRRDPNEGCQVYSTDGGVWGCHRCGKEWNAAGTVTNASNLPGRTGDVPKNPAQDFSKIEPQASRADWVDPKSQGQPGPAPEGTYYGQYDPATGQGASGGAQSVSQPSPHPYGPVVDPDRASGATHP